MKKRNIATLPDHSLWICERPSDRPIKNRHPDRFLWLGREHWDPEYEDQIRELSQAGQLAGWKLVSPDFYIGHPFTRLRDETLQIGTYWDLAKHLTNHDTAQARAVRAELRTLIKAIRTMVNQ